MIGPVYFHLFRHTFIESLAIKLLLKKIFSFILLSFKPPRDLINKSSPIQNKTLNPKVKSGNHAASENIKFRGYFMSL